MSFGVHPIFHETWTIFKVTCWLAYIKGMLGSLASFVKGLFHNVGFTSQFFLCLFLLGDFCTDSIPWDKSPSKTVPPFGIISYMLHFCPSILWYKIQEFQGEWPKQLSGVICCIYRGWSHYPVIVRDYFISQYKDPGTWANQDFMECRPRVFDQMSRWALTSWLWGCLLYTLPRSNIGKPENQWLEDEDFPFGALNGLFSGANWLLVLGRGQFVVIKNHLKRGPKCWSFAVSPKLQVFKVLPQSIYFIIMSYVLHIFHTKVCRRMMANTQPPKIGVEGLQVLVEGLQDVEGLQVCRLRIWHKTSWLTAFWF